MSVHKIRVHRLVHPFLFLAAAAVVVAAAVIAATKGVATAIAQQEDQDDDPAEVTTTETVVIAHNEIPPSFFRGQTAHSKIFHRRKKVQTKQLRINN